MTDFDPDAFLDSPSAIDPTFNPDEHLDNTISGNKIEIKAAAKTPPTNFHLGDVLAIPAAGIQNTGAAIIGGFRGLTELATTPGSFDTRMEAAANAVNEELTNRGYKPQSSGEEAALRTFASPKNPINWPSIGLRALGSGTLSVTGSPALATLAEVGPQAAAMVAGVRGAFGAPEAATAAEGAASRVAPEVPSGPAPTGFDSPPVKGGVDPAMVAHRAAVLQRVGFDTARDSALEGDALAAGSDAQMTKFREPAGDAAAAQFDAEKAGLTKHATNIVRGTGGSIGLDEDALSNRGQTIAAPFDALRRWFEGMHEQDYAGAKIKAEGKPISNLEGTQELLKDPDFTETLLAKDQGGLLGSVQRQFDRFSKLHPEGWTVDNAENFRKWLNQAWTPENSSTIGKIKGAVDDDVVQSAGEDIYGPARARVTLEHTLLDDPKGVAKLFDFDPNTPLNRTTPYGKIPDTLARLPREQFENVLQTLDKMPADIAPAAQAAKAEIKAHLANKLLDAGTSNRGLWNADAVSDVLNQNRSKFRIAFGDDPQAMQKITDLDSAGKILAADASYPGAAAQAANAMKRGLMSGFVKKGAVGAGAAVGGYVGGPTGAAAGAGAGEVLGGNLAQSLGEKGALNRFQRRLTKLSDATGSQPLGPTPTTNNP